MDHERNSLPKWAQHFLNIICPLEFTEEIEGDLLQQFNRNVKIYGQRKSSVKLFVSVLRFFRPGILFRKKFRMHNNRFDLFRNDLHFTFRQLRKNSLFSVLNFTGLSIAIAVVLLIAQYAGFHFSFDRQHESLENTFRVYSRNYEGSKLSFESALTNYKVGQTLRGQFPEVAHVSQLLPTDSWFDCALRYDSESGPRIYNERKLFFADESFLKIFRPALVDGDLERALNKPNSVVLTKSAASRYFTGGNPIGKILHLKGSFDQNDYQVAAVIEDFPINSHLDIEILMSLSSLQKTEGIDKADCYTYLQTHRDVDINSLAAKMIKLARQFPDGDNQRFEPDLQAVAGIHLYSSLQDEIKPGGDVDIVYFLIAIGIVILTIAWINYVNLSMSRIFERTREVGIRKVNGASKARLVSQFFTEALVINLLSVILAVIIVEVVSPVFQSLTGFSFEWRAFWTISWHNPLLYLVVFVSSGIILSANYPSSILASSNPLQVLKGRFNVGTRNNFSANVLITFQFTCSVVLAIVVLVIHSQYAFMQNQKAGIDIDRTLIVKAPAQIDSSYHDKFTGFKNYAASSLFVTQITSSTAVPGQEIEWTGRVSNLADGLARNIHIQVADTGYFNAYNVTLLSGRHFSVTDYPGEQFGTKEEPVIINEKAVEGLGFQSYGDAVGRKITWGENLCVIVGVVSNYHQQSLRSDFKPILYTANGGPLMSLKVTEDFEKDMKVSIGQLELAWNKFFPDNAFDYFYLSDFYASHYTPERNLRTILDIFSVLALITSCLGLLGVSAFAARRKLKEITIRKVLGADLRAILILLSEKFLVLVLVAALVAVPLAFLQSSYWLESYAFRIELRVWHFIVPVAVVMLTSLLTVLSQCWKVARDSSVNLLRSE